MKPVIGVTEQRKSHGYNQSEKPALVNVPHVKRSKMTEFKPGKYNISNEEYHASNGISRSTIASVINTECMQLYYQKYVLGKGRQEKPTEAMIFGSAFDDYLTSPESFNEKYIVPPKFNLRSNAGKEEFAAFKAESADKIILSEQDMMDLNGMRESFLSNPFLAKKLENSEKQASYYWIDKYSGMLCKTRPDFKESQAIWDIKTTSFINITDLEKQIYESFINIQAAMSEDGILEIESFQISDFNAVFVYKKPPYYVTIRPIKEEARDVGRIQYREVLKELKYYYDNPALWYMPEEIGIPHWAYDKMRGSKYAGLGY